jgi:glycine/D-amino acid oxidase-like deaminating enzyme
LGFPGITGHRHFELFESSVNKPDYLKWMPDVQLIDNFDTETIPRRNKAVELDGWSFECLFADWPIYLPALWNLYQSSGGSVTLKRLEPADIAELPTSVVINCSGTGARFLFEDPGEHLLLRGHLLFAPKAPLLKNNSGDILSYNYTPAKSVYADSEGKACDVYCYPRKDGWILGGSRQAGSTDKQKNWTGAEVASPFYKKSDIKFPAQIIDLNKTIIEKSLNTVFPNPEDMNLTVGYRYIRNRNNGLRLEKESVAGKTVFHNYGHGGAGVTLSWGCALDIAQKLQGNSDLREKLIYAIQKVLE